MRLTLTSDLWWKNAVIYCLDVETYRDGDGDGIGDFRGLSQQIDYLDQLGVTCIWLMPFYPSPRTDDGYDISDYYAVDPRLGTVGEFVEFLRTARDRGIRVIADLVVNHTSDRHPWFQDARSSREARYRDWYVWADEPADGGGSWTYDEGTGQYYLHRFYASEPDLNVSNPEVRDEIARVIGFWMELGLSGFRVDAVPFMLETIGPHEHRELPHPHDFLADLRSFLSRRSGDAILLGEVNLPYDQLMTFYGGGHELTMCFDFIGMQRLYLSLARKDARPLLDALRERPDPPKDGHWATFVRNHDELTLDKLSKEEQQEVFAAFGPDEDMQIYGHGLRRRLPPMLGGDARRLRMVYSLLFSLPGTPVLYYGEEIGMGENLAVEGRRAVRTPMQWRPGRGAGFSTGDPARFPAPLVEGEYGPDRVNVTAQQNDPDSLLSWIGLLIRRYRESPELAWAEPRLLDIGSPQVLAHRCGGVVVLHNFSDEEQRITLELDDLPDHSALVDLLFGGREEPGSELVLPPYGCRWLRLRSSDQAPA